jgi:hypothetical protein
VETKVFDWKAFTQQQVATAKALSHLRALAKPLDSVAGDEKQETDWVVRGEFLGTTLVLNLPMRINEAYLAKAATPTTQLRGYIDRYVFNATPIVGTGEITIARVSTVVSIIPRVSIVNWTDRTVTLRCDACLVDPSTGDPIYSPVEPIVRDLLVLLIPARPPVCPLVATGWDEHYYPYSVLLSTYLSSVSVNPKIHLEVSLKRIPRH